MPSFSRLLPASQLDGPSAAGLPSGVQAVDTAHPPPAPTKQRMSHWSSLKGPLTEGFRRQREREALRPQRQPAPFPPRSSQTNDSSNGMESSLPTHLTPIEPYQQVEPFAEPTFDIDENDQGSATSALDIYALNATRSANSATYRHFVLGDQAHDVAPAGFQDFDWAPPTISHVMDLQEVQPLPDIYDPELLDAQPMPYLSPHVDANSSYGNTPQIDWSALVPVMPLGEGELADQGSNPMSAPLVSRRRSRSPIDERYPHISSSPKRQRRTNSLSRKNRALKRKRSESRILKREKSNSFHEQYIESVRKSGKTPTDIDCFAYNDSDTDEDSKWSTLNLSKKRKDSDPVDAGPEVAAEDLPAAYTRFQPLYKPKVDNNARFVVNTSKFTLPVPALEKRRKDLAERARVSIIQSNSSVRTRKVPLFKPPPPTQRSASAHQGNKVIEIFDDEERKKQKAQVLRGLSSSALGLVQRPKSKSRDGDSPVEESGEYKSSLYKTTKLGNDMEATSSLPFTGLQPVQHDEEDWTSSPEGSPAPEAGPSRITGTNNEPTPAVAGPQNNAIRPPTPKKWTFKLFGRG